MFTIQSNTVNVSKYRISHINGTENVIFINAFKEKLYVSEWHILHVFKCSVEKRVSKEKRGRGTMSGKTREETRENERRGKREIMFNFLHWRTFQGPETPSWAPPARRASFAWESISCV